jgi:hypothetical protein
MKKFEKVLGIIVVIALVLKLASIPGASVLLTFSLSILSCFYYLFSFAFFNNIKLKNIFNRKSYEGILVQVLGSIGIGVVLAHICIGILFHVHHWQGATMLLYAGLITAFIVAVVFLITYPRSKSNFTKAVILRTAIIGGLGLLILLT